MKSIYLDNHATTRIDPRVLEAMMPYLTECYGNPSSRTHRYGWQAEEALETAREQVAALINAEPDQIIFTSGATESNNIVLHKIVSQGGNIISSGIEHSSIKVALEDNWHADTIITKSDGLVDLNDFRHLLDTADSDICGVFIMKVNNEIGTIQPVRTVKGVVPWYTFVHSDMAQALGKIKIDVKDSKVDSASFSAHKIYGPKGVGALYVADPDKIVPLFPGTSHEFGLRPGTQNVPGIVGFGKACEIMSKEHDLVNSKILNLRKVFCECLQEMVPDITIHNFSHAVANTVSLAVPCTNMDVFMSDLEPYVAVSFGSACMSLHNEQSYVLKAVSIPEEEIYRSLRIGIGRFNTEEEITLAAIYIRDALRVANTED